MRSQKSSYISKERMVSKPPSFQKIVKSFAALITMLIFAITALSGISIESAFAEEDDKSKMEESLKSYTEGYESGEDDEFVGLLKKVRDEKQISRNSFAYVFARVMNTGYLNHTPDGEAGNGMTEQEWNCKANHPGRNTALYHNCDVPNILTEFLQKLVALASPMGPEGANVEDATTLFNFGLPSNIPGGVVPIKESERTAKYTGLELFGYNMRYTLYRGEWDQIQVMTTARAMANFGFMDYLNLGVKAAVKGVVSGVGEGTGRAWDNLKKGKLISAGTSFFEGIDEGSKSRTANAILDSSDMNVFNTYGWYRVNYGNTLYNARELSEVEIAANMNKGFIEILKQSKPKQASLPEKFTKLKGGPPKPKEDIASCTVNGRPYGASTVPPGVTEAECMSAGGSWSKTGTQAGVTLEAWKTANAQFFADMKEYKIECEIDTSEGDRANKLAVFYRCIEVGWNTREPFVLEESQVDEDNTWANAALTWFNVFKHYANKGMGNNHNSPFKRFICVDENGVDMRKDGDWRYHFNLFGGKDPACKPMRPPVQNGYFGNGYVVGGGNADYPQAPVRMDTRWEIVEKINLINLVIDLPALSNSISNQALSTSIFLAKVSNTALDLSFSPIMSKLKIDSKAVSLIESLRDSIFFPLAMFAGAIAAIQILYRAGRQRMGIEGFKQLFFLAGTFVLGAILLYSPREVVRAVDTWPTRVETTIVGVIYNLGNTDDDDLCTASDTVSNDENNVDINGKALPTSAEASVRSMVCNVWRIYALEPYVGGQWGTSYNTLHAVNTPMEKKMRNTNTELVGDARVNMGGNVHVNNWGLYQLKTLTSGTATTADPFKVTGSVPTDFYRIVDMQAGPDNGAGTDGRFFRSWAGYDPMGRLLAAFISVVSGITGAITIVTFSIVKIELTFVSIFMILFLPFVLLIGLFPGQGRSKLKAYAGTILLLMLQRIMLVALLAIMIKILVGFALSTENYAFMGILASAIAMAFFMYRKALINMITQTTSKTFGAPLGQNLMNNPYRTAMGAMPTAAQNYMNMNRAKARAVAAGAIGGFATGGISGVRKGIFGEKPGEDGGAAFRGALSVVTTREDLRQFRKGLGPTGSVVRAARDAQRNAKNELSRDEVTKKVQNDLNDRQRADFEDLKDSKVGPKGKFHVDLNNKQDLADLRKLKDIQAKIDRLENIKDKPTSRAKSQLKTSEKFNSGEVKDSQGGIDHSGEILDEQKKMSRSRYEKDKKIAGLQKDYYRVQDRMYRRHNDPSYRGTSRMDRMRGELHEMNQALNDARTIAFTPKDQIPTLLEDLEKRDRAVSANTLAVEDAAMRTMEAANKKAYSKRGYSLSDAERKASMKVAIMRSLQADGVNLTAEELAAVEEGLEERVSRMDFKVNDNKLDWIFELPSENEASAKFTEIIESQNSQRAPADRMSKAETDEALEEYMKEYKERKKW